jgi:hypothetical protein
VHVPAIGKRRPVRDRLHSTQRSTSRRRTSVWSWVRRLFDEQLKALARGDNPINVSFDPSMAPIKLSSGNWTTYPLSSLSAGARE